MAKANRRDLSGVGGAAQEDLIATATMAERIGVSPYTLREALGSIAKRDSRGYLWWEPSKTAKAAKESDVIQRAIVRRARPGRAAEARLDVPPPPRHGMQGAMQPLYSGPAERYMVAPRVAVVFKRRDQVGGFISIYKVSQGETLPNRPRLLDPGLWMTHSAVGGEMPCPYTLAELRQAYATGDVCADGALTFVPKADPAREAAERAADRAERWAAVAHG